MFVKKIGIVAGALIVLTLVTAAAGGRFDAAHAAPTEVPPGSGSQGPVGPEDGPTLPVVPFPPLERASARVEEPKPKKDEPKKEPEPITLKGHTSGVSSVCFSPDGKRIASLAKHVTVWDAEKGQELLTLKGHTGPVSGVCFSPDSKRLASASWDQTVKVWSLDQEK